MDDNGMFVDAIDESVFIDVVDNDDDKHVVINILGADDGIGIALTYEQLHELADHLHTFGY